MDPEEDIPLATSTQLREMEKEIRDAQKRNGSWHAKLKDLEIRDLAKLQPKKRKVSMAILATIARKPDLDHRDQLPAPPEQSRVSASTQTEQNPSAASTAAPKKRREHPEESEP